MTTFILSGYNSFLYPGKIVYYMRKTVEKNNLLDRTFVRFEYNSVLFINYLKEDKVYNYLHD